MGVSDCRSILGNRAGQQQGLNFDDCPKEDRSGDGYPDMLRIDDEQRIAIKDLIKSGSFHDLSQDVCCEDFEIDIECASLVIEVLQINGISKLEMPPIMVSETAYNEFEEEFMREIYPNLTKESAYTCYANCDEWEFRKSGDQPIPKNFEYFDYFHTGIFKFNNQDKQVSGKVLTPKIFFDDFDPGTQEVWVRIWYAQVWNGVILVDKFEPTLISDECLVYVAEELEIDEPWNLTRNVLFDKVKKLVTERYFTVVI